MIRVQSVSDTSSLFELTRFLSTSFQESERIQVEHILSKREQGFKDQIFNFKQLLEKDVKFLEKQVQLLEKQVKEEHFIKEFLENEVKGLKKECGLMEKKLSLACIEKRVVEDKMERQCEMFEDEIEAMQKDFKQELEKLRNYHNKELGREVGFLEKKLSFAALEKLILEEEVRKTRIEFEEKMKGYGEIVKPVKEEMKAEIEKSRENYAELKRECVLSEDKLILAELEIGNLVEGLRNIRKEFEEKLKEHCDLNQNKFEDELNKLRESNKKELEGERDMSENKLILIDLEKLDLGEELRKSRVDFEQRLEALEGKNRDLHKELELYKGTSVSMCKSAGKVKSGCSFLENEPEDGSDNDNLMCKRKRIDTSKNDKANPAVKENTEGVLESVRKNDKANGFLRKSDTTDPDISEAIPPPRFNSAAACIKTRTDKSLKQMKTLSFLHSRMTLSFVWLVLLHFIGNIFLQEILATYSLKLTLSVRQLWQDICLRMIQQIR